MHETTVKGILSPKNGMNPYRGCTHGCVYCDSRSRCYGMTHDFEDVEVKINAPRLLESALSRKRSRRMIVTGAMCDPYLPLEADVGLTRRCLEIIDRYGFGASVLTKSDLVLRDLDLLKSIHEKAKCVVQMTLTTFDEALCRVLEPGVCTTARRLEVLRILRDSGIPTVVWLCPILPFINDTKENIRGILDGCIKAGVHGIVCFGMGVTLRDGNREYFYQKLDEHFPGVQERYVRTFGDRYVCASKNEPELMKLFRTGCRENGILYETEDVFDFVASFENRRFGEQMRLF